MKSYDIKLIPTAKNDIAEMLDYLSGFYPSTAVRQYDRIMRKSKN